MRKKFVMGILLIALIMAVTGGSITVSAATADTAPSDTPKIFISDEMGKAMIREASRVKAEIRKQAQSLFVREPLGWDWKTIESLYGWLISLPLKIPAITQEIMEQSRVLGVVGSLVILMFIIALFYSLTGQKKVLARVERKVEPFEEKLPKTLLPFFQSALKVLIEALIPILLLVFFSLINELIKYQAGWFQLLGRLLFLWALGALINGILRESLTRDLIPAALEYGNDIYRSARWVLFYTLLGIAAFRGADVFSIREDILALLRFAVSVSIAIALYLLLLKKDALLSLLPALSYRSYQGFVRYLKKYYHPLVGFSFAIALLWCLGYKDLGRVVLTKIWASAAAFVLLMLIYHSLLGWLQKWSRRVDPMDEAARLLIRSLKALLLYASITATVIIVLNLLGLLYPLQRIMSFPVFGMGATQVTFWTILKAILILLAFVFGSRLLQAYLDYKIYPAIGIDPGLGYALNTFIKYVIIAVGILVSLRIVGIDLRFLLVFAGALGIGIGLGLQNLAANIISGFVIIFGGKIRKGDWIEAGGTLGMITDIYMRATKVRTRDNIEYLIPNSELIASTIINYSLSSPMIRIEVPVGVSYGSNPEAVKKILLEVAEKEPMVERYRPPAVIFVEFADSSLNFELLIWINVQKTARKKIRSRLNFAIFEAFKEAGIEIPFPQRDIHIRTQVQKQ